jgi:predicted DNA-binding transcriptional regulator AlpA
MTSLPKRSRSIDTADETWLTPKEICALLQIPEQTFYQWRAKHVGPRAYRIGRHLADQPQRLCRLARPARRGITRPVMQRRAPRP